MVRRVLPLLAAAMLAGCGTSQFRAVPPSAQYATVYVYRLDDVQGGAYDKDSPVLVDGRHVLDLGPRRYSAMYLPPGDHMLVQYFPNSPDQKLSRAISVKAGETYFFKCCTFIIGYGGIDVTLGDGLMPVAPKDAGRDIRYTHYQLPLD